jgi:hypothetical protein
LREIDERYTTNDRLSDHALEAREREVSALHSAIEPEQSEVQESANRTEREMPELVTEIGLVSSASAAARETLSRRVDSADKQLTRSERGSAGLAAEVEAPRKRSEEARE